MHSDTRNSPRKVLRCHITIEVPGAAPIHGRTMDLSLGGVSVMVTEQIPLGKICKIAFETVLNGKMYRVAASAKVIYAILTGVNGFRTGLEFTEIDAANNRTLTEMMV